MPGDAPSRTTPVGEWSRPDPRRRQSHTTPSARPPGVRPSTNPTAQGYFQSHFIDQVSEGQHPTPHSLPHTGLHYPPVSSYPMGSGFYGQYTVPSQPSLGVARTSPYPYSHGYHSPGGVDSNVGRREMQSNFQPMAPPPHPQYSYPQHSQDDSSSSGQVLLTASSSRFASHPPPAHSPTSQPYIGSGHYPGMAYPSPMANPQYTYPSHFPATPPMYRPYGPIAYPQHAASAPEEAQGAWYFLSHGTHAPPQPYHYEGGQYQHPYTTRYPHHPDQATLRASATNFRTGAVHSSTASTPLTAPQSGPLTPAPPLAPPYAADTSPRPPTSRPLSASGKPVSRREWHPKPPPHRSPWVMWVGNVPADATQEELWEFFSCDPGGGDSSEEAATFGAVVSIFLIARSNCAFINYSDESSLEAAIKTFHGKRLRPNDPQCPMLVCKVRRSTDDLKSGVGGQRGTGMHKQWVKEQRKLQQSQPGILADASQSDDASISSQSVLDLVDRVGSVSFDPNQPQERRTTKQSSSSESYTSTSSSLLGEHFPTRYFILKSLSEVCPSHHTFINCLLDARCSYQRDLEISVQGGLWATQKHNELILDRAYRTSRDVFLIFSVNKSGEFYGYARYSNFIPASYDWYLIRACP
jgi:RNA recognition motif-containing protein